MIEVGLRDGMFPSALSMSAGGENVGMAPRNLYWNRMGVLPITVYTDHCMPLVEQQTWPGRKIGLLIEAPKFRPGHYQYAVENERRFDYILTYHKELLETRDPERWLWYPHCGSRIKIEHWGVHPKRRMVSFLASDKQGAAEGHSYRHEVYARFKDRLDVHGAIGGGQHATKRAALGCYYYTVIVAGERADGLFCDHLIDALALGTIPIYWQQHDIGDYFDVRGMLCCENLDELEAALDAISERDYIERLEYVHANLGLARQYRCAEDWLYENYPWMWQ